MAEHNERRNTPQLCDVCSVDDQGAPLHTSKDACSFCGECMEFLCRDCILDHSNNEILKTHTILHDVKEVSSTLHHIKNILQCEEHGILRSYVCNDHYTLICEVCIKRNHRSCKNLVKSTLSPPNALAELQKINEDLATSDVERANLMKRMESTTSTRRTLLTKLQTFVEKSLEEGNHEWNQIEPNCGSSDDKMKDNLAKQDMLRIVSKFNDSAKDQILANYIYLSLSESNSSSDDLKSVEQAFIKAEEFTKKLALIEKLTNDDNVEFGADIEKNRHSNRISVEIQTDAASKTHTKCQDFSASSDSCQIEDTNVRNSSYSAVSGNIQVQKSFHDSATMTQIASLVDVACQTRRQDFDRHIPVPQKSLMFTGAFQICKEDEQNCNVAGIVVFNENIIVAADSYNNNLKFMNQIFHQKYCIPLFGEPVSICRIQGNKLAVACEPRKIKIFSVGDPPHLSREFPLRLHCRGICEISADSIAMVVSNKPIYSKSGDPIDISSNVDKIQIEFRKIDNGKILRVIDRFSEELDTPIYISRDKIGRLILGETDRVTAFNENGDREWFYKSYKNGELEGTMGLDIDEAGNIYVCGQGSNNIHQVSCMNFRQNRVLIPYIPSPRSVVYDAFNDRIIIGCTDCKFLFVYEFM